MTTQNYCKFQETLGDRDWLYARYVTECLSAQRTGKTIGASNHTVRDWLEYHQIPIRNMQEANQTDRRRVERSGSNNPMWRGGTRKSNGRVFVKSPNHPRKDQWGYIPRYWKIVEKSIGRHLTKEEHVHHINGKKDDDRLANLRIISNEEHIRIHTKDNLGFIKNQFKKGQVPHNAKIR